jgi:hypothetical protein
MNAASGAAAWLGSCYCGLAYATTLLDVKVGFSKHFTFANYLGFTPIVVPWRKPQRLQGRAAIIFFHHSFWRGGST